MTKYKSTKHNSSRRSCSVSKCNSRCTREISLHSIPKDKHLKEKWAQAIKLEKSSPFEYVCSLHFHRTDYLLPHISRSQPRLKRGTVPSLNIPGDSTQEKIQKRSTKNTKSEVKDNILDPMFEKKTMKTRNDVQKQSTKKTSIIDFIKSDAQLNEFCGIPSLKLLDEIVKGVKLVENQQDKIPDQTMPILHRVLLTFIKIKLNLSLVCLSAIFRISDDLCETYFNETIYLLRAFLLYTIENFPENGAMLRILMPTNKRHPFYPFDHV